MRGTLSWRREICPQVRGAVSRTFRVLHTPGHYGNINLVMNLPYKRSKKGITINIKVEPRSSRKGFAGVVGDALKIRVNSPPVGGAANDEVIETISEELGIRKTSIKIIRGATSKNKVVEIQGIDSLP